MKNIFMLLLISLSMFGASTIHYYAYTYDRTITPNTATPVESVYVFAYDDDGVTKLDSGYTNALGYFSSSKVTMEAYQRAYYSKTGYSTQWIRFATPNIDTLNDNTVCIIPMKPGSGLTTRALTVRVVDLSGAPLVGTTITVKSYSARNMFSNGSNKYMLLPSNNTSNFTSQSSYTDAAGEAIFDIIDSSYISVDYSNVLSTTVFQIVSDMDLDNVIPKP